MQYLVSLCSKYSLFLLTKVFFEGGGGSNPFESYTAAWYFALNNTKLDCHNRGKKGIIITLGDEPLNPYLPGAALSDVLGCSVQDVDTKALYEKVVEKFDVYHIAITDTQSFWYHKKGVEESWGKVLGQHCIYGKCDDIPDIICNIVDDALGNKTPAVSGGEGISW